MSASTKNRSKFSIILKLSLGLSTFFFISLLLLGCLLLFLPRYISSEHFRRFVETRVTETTNLPVHIGNLQWEWSGGFLIEDILIDDNPDFSKTPFLYIRKAGLTINYKEIFKRAISSEIFLDQMNVKMIRNDSGITNVEALLSKAASPETKIGEVQAPAIKKNRPAEKLQKKHETVPFRIPIDIKTKLRMDNLSFEFEDSATQQKVNIDKLSVHLDAPSIMKDPVKLMINSNLEIDGRRLTSPEFRAKISHLVNADRTLDIVHTRLDINSTLSGVNITADGMLAKSGVNGSINIDLKQLANDLEVFFPPDFSGSEIFGDIEISLNASGDSLKTIDYNIGVNVKQVGISGEIIENKKAGPVSFNISNAGVYDADGGSLSIDQGRLKFLEKGSLEWQGQLSGLVGDAIGVDFKLGPGTFDLRELLYQAGPFMPSGIGISLKNKEAPAAVQIGSIGFSGDLTARNSDFILENVSMKIPGIDIKIETPPEDSAEKAPMTNHILVSGINFHADLLQTALVDFFPENLVFKAGVAIADVNIRGETDLHVEKINIPLISIRSDHLEKDKDALFGLTGDFSLGQNLDISRIKIPELITLKDFNQSVDATFHLVKGAPAKFVLNRLKLACPKVTAYLSENIKLNLEGTTELNWRASGRLPDENEMKVLENSEVIKKKDLSFIDFLDVHLKADKIKAAVDMGAQGRVHIGSIYTRPSFRYLYEQKPGRGKIDGRLYLAGIEKIPGIKLNKPMTIVISFSGQHDFLRSVSFTQTVEIEPLRLKEELTMSIYGMDRLIGTQMKAPLPKIMKTIGGNLKGHISLQDSKGISLLFDGVDVRAQLDTGVEMQMQPDTHLQAKAYMNIPFANIRLEELAQIENFQANIDLKKKYRIITQDKRKALKKGRFLSAFVMTDGSATYAGIKNTPPSGLEGKDRSAQTLFVKNRKRFGNKHTISLDRAHVSTGAFPLNIAHSNVDFCLNKGLPNVEYFSLDLLGGTVIGSVFITKSYNGYSLQADVKFSGLDTAKLISGRDFDARGIDAEISGQLTANIPMSVDMDFLLGNINMTVEISHIGPRTLERALYALDPSGSNESIVLQRRLLRTGYPKWIKVLVKDGNLSISGEVSAAGISVDLPKLQRINIANLSVVKAFEQDLADIKRFIEFMDILSADAINFGKEGETVNFESDSGVH